MCGRYFIDSDEPTMGTMLSALSPETPIHGGEVFPSNMAPVITRHGELTTMLWGFPRFDGKGLIINARSETAAEKPCSVPRCAVWPLSDPRQLVLRMGAVRHGKN